MNTRPQHAPRLLVGAGERRVDLLDGGAGRLEALGGRVDGGGDLRVDGPAAEVDGQRRGACPVRSASSGAARSSGPGTT